MLMDPASIYSKSVSNLISFAKEKLGAPYKYGGKGPNAFDCSGFTQFVFNEFNINLAASSALQYEQGKTVKLKKVEIGDLIFFKSSNVNSKDVGHVGIVCEINANNDTVCFIHASTSNGVRIDKYPGYDYYNIRYVGCKRIIDWDTEKKEEEEKDEKDSIESKDQELSPENPIIAPEIVDNESNDVKKKEVSPLPEPKPKPEPKPHKETKTHKVKKGETLYRIAKKYKCTVEEIRRWNNLDNDNLRIDQILIVSENGHTKPDKKEKDEIKPIPQKKEDNKHKKDSKEDDGLIHHIVKKGETLYRISKNYGCTTEEIADWNDLNSNNIQIGQILIIKKSKKEH